MLAPMPTQYARRRTRAGHGRLGHGVQRAGTPASGQLATTMDALAERCYDATAAESRVLALRCRLRRLAAGNNNVGQAVRYLPPRMRHVTSRAALLAHPDHGTSVLRCGAAAGCTTTEILCGLVLHAVLVADPARQAPCSAFCPRSTTIHSGRRSCRHHQNMHTT